MEFTIKKIAELSGISRRTLRYYDEIGLLKPGRINSSGYRIYTQKDIDKLQQIKTIMYKERKITMSNEEKFVRMYVCDERFKQYYDKNQPGTTEFLKNAVLIYTGMTE